MKYISIKTKLVTTAGICFFSIIAILTGYNGIHEYNNAVLAAKENAMSTARSCSSLIRAEIEVALDAARTLAQTLSAVKDKQSPLEIGRDQVNGILRTLLEKNKNFLGVYTLWEPDAFDQMDASYAGLDGHDHTGRLIPYWTRGPKGLVVEPLAGYETDGTGDYYQIPKKTKAEVIIDPYLYPVQGKEVLMTSLVVPILYDGQFYGIAGVDIALDRIQSLISDIELHGMGTEVVILSNSGRVVAVPNRLELQGKTLATLHADYKEDLSFVNKGVEIIQDDEGRFAFFTPIQFGKTETPWSVNINMPYDVLLGEAKRGMWWTIGLGASVSLISLVILYVLIAKAIKPLSGLASIAEKVAVGDLHYDKIETSNDEIGKVCEAFNQVAASLSDITLICQAIAVGDLTRKAAVRSGSDTLSISINQMNDNLRSVVLQANSVAQGNYAAAVEPRSEADELGVSLVRMTEQLRNSTEESKKENWLKTGQAELNDRIRGEQSIVQLSQSIISYLASYLGAQIGAIYIISDKDEGLEMVGSYAYTRRKGITNHIGIGEGIVGQSVLEKRAIILSDVPEDYVVIQSGLGSAQPENIMVVPLQYDNQVVGVIELGALYPFTDIQMLFLQKASESIAIAVNSAKSRVKMAELLEETQRQSEELQNQQEELKAVNEELEQQAERLRESEKSLKVQQETLEAVNSELENKTQVLEEQKEKLEQSWDELNRKSRELETVNRYKSEFLSNMSHELRTPLNSLLILSKMLIDNTEGNLTPEQIESAKVIYEGGNDLLSLINEILDLSKIEAGKMEIIRENVSLQDIIDDIRKKFIPLADKKKLKFKTSIDADLPQSILTDEKRVNQVMRNLIANAIKFTDQGTVAVAIKKPAKDTVLAQSKLDLDRVVAFSVSDTGIGIPGDKKQLIFQAFQQADGSIDRKYGGTGLGLSISKEIARLLGGEIQLESEVGKGSTFTMYLPVELEASDDNITQAVKSDRSCLTEKKDCPPKLQMTEHICDDRENINENDKVILIVEDDVKFARILVEMSHAQKFKCIVAENGETGIRLARDKKPDAVILDVGLPDMDGFDVIDKLKDCPQTRHIPVHFISGRDEKQSKIKAMNMGAIGYVTKPVTREQLMQTFEALGNCISNDIKKLLIVEDDANSRESIAKLIKNDDVEIFTAQTGRQAHEMLKNDKFDCMVLDLGLPDISGFDLLNRMKDDAEIMVKPPVVVYSGKELSREEASQLREYAGSVIIKGAESPERLLDETSLFLHQMVRNLPQEQHRMIRMAHEKESILQDKKVLVVDDDIRNVFALSHALKSKGMNVLRAENGQKAIEVLHANEDIDIVLMDIMMPVMDGYEAIRNIRKQEKYWKLPILALTAKAMTGDRQKCIEMGANDYIAKPIDIEKVLSMLRVWLYV